MQLSDGQRLRMDLLAKLIAGAEAQHEQLAAAAPTAADGAEGSTASGAATAGDSAAVQEAGEGETEQEGASRAQAQDLLAALASLELGEDDEAPSAEAGTDGAGGSGRLAEPACERTHGALLAAIGSLLRDAANGPNAGPQLWGCLARCGGGCCGVVFLADDVPLLLVCCSFPE